MASSRGLLLSIGIPVLVIGVIGALLPLFDYVLVFGGLEVPPFLAYILIGVGAILIVIHLIVMASARNKQP